MWDYWIVLSWLYDSSHWIYTFILRFLDCLSTICSEPYTNSPPGTPCKCVWPMKVGLRLSVPLYTFFPLVSELASEIATGVFMRQSQVRIMGANAASQQPDKTDALIDLVPLGEEFDNTTAFLTSERFWHKQVVIKASYFGDYEVLYVSYRGIYIHKQILSFLYSLSWLFFWIEILWGPL